MLLRAAIERFIGGSSRAWWLAAAAVAALLAAPVSAQPNAPPSFGSAPVTTATVNVAYQYSIIVNDPDPADSIVISANVLPDWLALADNGNRTATLSGTPEADDVGPQTVELVATDGDASVEQSFTVTVAPGGGPVAEPDSYETEQGEALSVNPPNGVLANDTNPNPGPLTAVLVTGVSSGTLTLAPNGSFTFTPAAGFSGNVTFTYRATAGPLQSNTATVTIAVAPGNAAPNAVNDSYTTPEDTQLTVTAANGVLANDTDADGESLTAALVDDVDDGTLTLNANGSFIYVPDANFSGQDTFTYRASDGDAQSNVGTVSITVSSGNDPPSAANDSYTTNQDTPLAVNAANGVLANDQDADDEDLTAVLVAGPSSGTLLLNANGSFNFTPAAAFAGSVTFTYQANDGTAASNTATVTITVSAVDRPPTAAPDSYTTAEDTPLTVPAATGVLANDSDPDSPATPLTAALVGSVSTGSLMLAPNGGFTFTPPANFHGTARFTYQARSGTLSSPSATVTINVTPVNDPPFISSTPPSSVAEGAAYSYTVTASDPDDTSLTFAAPTLPAWLTFVPPATITGTPGPNDVGVHDVTVTASDGTAAPVAQSFEITVQAVDNAPAISAIPPQTATELTPYSLDLAAFVTDPDTPANAITYRANGPLPAGLALSAAGVLAGTPTGPSDGPIRVLVADAANTVPLQFQLTVLRAERTDLAVAVSAAPNPVAINSPSTWTMTVSNQAAAVGVNGVTLDVSFGGDVPFRFDAPAPPGCTATPSGTGTALHCTLGPLAGGASTTVSITGSGGFAGDVFATAVVAVSGGAPIDETPRNDRATASLGIAQRVAPAAAQRVTGLAARAAAAGDFDADGFDDLVVATGTASGTVLLMNVVDPANPHRRVLSSVPTALGGEALGNDVAVADLDGDGDLDVVTASGAGAPSRVFLSSPAGFTTTALTAAAGDERAVAVADLNGDTFPDIAFATSAGIAVYVNQGAGGTFAAGPVVGAGDVRDVTLTDLLGDVLPELVAANASGDAAVYRNTAGAFAPELTLATGAATSVAAADFNNDQRTDLAFGRDTAAASGANPSDLVLLNTSGASGQFFLADELGSAATRQLVPADVDLDGDVDLVTVTGDGQQVYANVGGGTGTFALHPQQLAAAAASMAVPGSFSVDERVDVAVVAGGDVAVFYNDGSGNLGLGDAEPPTIQLRGEPSVVLNVGDPYTDPGATAMDATDGDVSARIAVTGTVDPNVIGNYTLTYDATDLSGNSAVPVKREVRVQAREAEGGGGGALALEAALLAVLAWLVRRRRTPLAA